MKFIFVCTLYCFDGYFRYGYGMVPVVSSLLQNSFCCFLRVWFLPPFFAIFAWLLVDWLAPMPIQKKTTTTFLSLCISRAHSDNVGCSACVYTISEYVIWSTSHVHWIHNKFHVIVMSMFIHKVINYNKIFFLFCYAVAGCRSTISIRWWLFVFSISITFIHSYKSVNSLCGFFVCFVYLSSNERAEGKKPRSVDIRRFVQQPHLLDVRIKPWTLYTFHIYENRIHRLLLPKYILFAACISAFISFSRFFFYFFISLIKKNYKLHTTQPQNISPFSAVFSWEKRINFITTLLWLNHK